MTKPTKRYRASLLLPLLAFTTSCTEAPQEQFKELATTLSTVTKYNDEPHYVEPALALRCAIWTDKDTEEYVKKYGPHQMPVNIYLNPSALAAIEAQEPFPAGAVVIKKQMAADPELKMVGGMVKMAEGCDTANQDWLYFALKGNGEYHEGKLTSCSGCHSRDPDAVFGHWMKAEHVPSVSVDSNQTE